MALIKKRATGTCNPIVTGLLPILAFIVGIVLCNVVVTNDSYIIDQSDWFCSKFDNGSCVQFTFKPQPVVDPDKIMKNEPK